MTPVAGPSGPRVSYDYTDGASPIDINKALASRRSTSEFSVYNDDEGTMFDGPGHTVNPSSVTRMSNLDPARRSWSRSRRKSHDSGVSGRPSLQRRPSHDSIQSQVSRQSIEGEDLDAESARNTLRGRRRRSPSPPVRTSVLGNLANLFSGKAQNDTHHRRLSTSSRRSSGSFSRRSSRGSDYAVESDEERWGYSSGEEGSDDELLGADNASVTGSMMEYDSEPPSPTMAQSLPLLTSDPVFGGESRIDMEFSFEEMDPPPPGPPSRQQIYIEDDDSTIRLVGYEILLWRQRVWRICCVLTFGILAGFVVVESSNKDIILVSLQKLDYPFPITTVFPSTLSLDQSTPTFFNESNETYNAETKMLHSLVVVNYRHSRFALDPRNGLFYTLRNWRDSSWVSSSALQPGLLADARHQRAVLFDRNEINIEAKSTIALLIDEVIHPFYVFQVASIILWSLDDYYYYAFCIFAISVGSITTTLIETKKTITRMREMSKFSCKVSVIVDGAWIEIDSTELVPGDIINLSSSQLSIIPADMFLLAGDAILNESMLTGESIPVSKIPVTDEDLIKWKDGKVENPKSFIYSGTKVVRIRASVTSDGSQGRPALAVIARTGFDTTKGALVRSMLFPKPIGFKFYRDSVRFIGVLAGIAMLGFSISAVQFVRMGLKWQTILIRALDLITVVVPPALPATLSIGTSFAISRLKKSGIYCISPSRINIAGKINVCCFDKTGTLTEDGLDILGVRPLDRNVNRFGELLDDIHDLPLGKDKASFLQALATCHSLKMVDGDVVGDPLDVKMFEFTKWTLEEGTVGRTGVIKAKSGATVEQTALVQTVVRPPGSAQFKLEDALKGNAKVSSTRAHFLELGVIRMYEFVSSLRRMSVVVKRLKSSSMEIYVKGAPEVMADICEQDSFPDDYDDLLSYYTKRGYRVIAMAGKSIEGLSWLKAQRMKRESKLRFLGLIIFENKIKAGTAPAIHALRNAHLACRMITGDNPLTAVSVARECGLVNPAAYVFSPSFVRGDANTPNARIEWTSTDEPSWKLDTYSLKPLAPPPHYTVEEDEIGSHDYSLVVSGDVFRWMITYAPLETLQRMLVKAQVFARMSPDEKNEVVERLQGLGYTVLMCGDGANDCAALKAADVGISLSEAEASVAAPFTTSTPDIGCVLELIKEGRAALVTSFSCFKYMALYSLIQFTTVTLLYSFASSLGDFQFLYIDLFIIIPIAVTMGRTLPYPRIYPKRPTASLVSKKVLSSIIGQIILTSAVQLWAYSWVRKQDWYVSPFALRYTPPPSPDTKEGSNQLESTNFENSVLFLISCFQYILVAGVFSIGPPYRKPMWTNVLLVLSLTVLTAFNLLVLLLPPQSIADLLTLMLIPQDGRLKLLMAVAINIVVCILYEEFGALVVAGAVGKVIEWRKESRKIRETDGKVYKAVEVGMR
ncbi:Ca-transporting ATPase [Rhodocollybia butyracea]|uniref:Ca-transporting ATPase n=1 Tax=Rhodocollybia butyracea TaxID=206335 RepID=A0A9P5U5V6_9AGAR|nr:Ca-transporting ATPase [Rhodocollybia butyracea]